ncbi:MAG: helix-turn-helix domain-containing protein [Alphaproteobacteria bacterium]|nr:helix-turn-helix domain-containing protein [Alphaproteobacteria bacterium]
MKPEIASTSVSVSLMALPAGTPAGLYGLYEVLSSAGVAWPALTGGPESAPYFDVKIVGPSRQPFDCAIGISITPHAAFAEVSQSDIVIVPDLMTDADPRGSWPEATEWVRKLHDSGALICSVCTGSLLLADAGLLDGMEATTHWSAIDIFTRYYPSVTLRPESTLVLSGEAQRIITSGGAAFWEDLALYLTTRFCGQAEAVRTAKIFLLGDRSEGQLPYAAMGAPRRHEDAVIAKVQVWIADHYTERAPVARMSVRSGLPERTFKRRFKIATGYAPVEYVQTLRIEEAKQMLETSGDVTEDIGRQVGYEDPAHFRRLFKRRTGLTPSRYRQRYQAVGMVKNDGYD